MNSPFSLDGRTILLTGASGHLGQAMVQSILDAGAELILTGRTADKLHAVVSQQSADSKSRCHVIVGDISSPAGVAAVCEEVQRRFVVLHGLVNNASSGRVGDFHAIDASDFLFSCQHDLIAPFLFVKLLLPLLERAADQNGEASIVNVATMYGTVSPYPEVYGDTGLNNPIQYGASKAGMIQMTRYLACHLGNKRIRVNSVAPGPFPNTDSPSVIPDFYGTLATKVPMGRVGVPREAAHPVVFLLSSAASFINGVNLPIDGGWTAW